MDCKMLTAIGGAVVLGGCGLTATSLRDASPAERCANVMRAAMPKAEIAVTAAKAASDDTRDLNAIRATAEGTIQPRPEGVKPQATASGPVAMECLFHDGVLVQLSWLAGPEAGK